MGKAMTTKGKLDGEEAGTDEHEPAVSSGLAPSKR